MELNYTAIERAVKGGEEMNEWQIITMLITIISGVGLIVKPVCNLTKAITELTITCKNLQNQFLSFEAHNKDSHKRLWDHAEEQDGVLDDHEKRIFKLEERRTTHEKN